MSRALLSLWLALLVGGAAFGGFACGGNNVSQSGAAGRGGGGGGGGGGAGGAGGSDGGAGTGGSGGASGTGGCAVGIGGSGGAATGGGTGGELTPQQINDALFNAPTMGGIDVTRDPPTSAYPDSCQPAGT